MVSPDLLNYVRDEFSRGVSLGDLRKALLDEGWHVDEVEHALRSVRGHKPRFMVKSFGGQVFLLVLLVFVTVAVLFVVFAGSDRVVDCGSDMDCFLDSLVDCRSAVVVGERLLTTSYTYDEVFSYEVRGLVGDSCVVRYVPLNISVSSADEDFDIVAAEEVFGGRVGLEAFCSVPLGGVDSLLLVGDRLLFSPGVVCRGSLVEYLSS